MSDLQLDDEDFDDEEREAREADNIMFLMRSMGEFYGGYPRLMRMAKEYYVSQNKDRFLNEIPLDVNPGLEDEMGMKPSTAFLEIIFSWLINCLNCPSDLDFVIAVSELIRNESHALLFEGMIYMKGCS